MKSGWAIAGSAVMAAHFMFVAFGGCSLVIDTDKLRNGGPLADAGDGGALDGTSGDVATDAGDTAPIDTFSPAPVIAKVYVVSGDVAGKQSTDVLVADFRDDGTLSSWTPSTKLGAAAATDSLTVIGDTVYVVGVDSNADTTMTVRFAKLDKAVLGDWALVGSFPRVARGKLGAAGIPGFLFGIGGADVDRVGLKEVLYAPLGSTGTPGTWTPTMDLPAERYDFARAQWKEHVWVMTGADATGAQRPTVFHATLASTGATWDTLKDLSFSAIGAEATVAGNFVYLVGGYGGDEYRTVWYAPIGSDGALGSWTASSNTMLYGHAEHAVVAIGTKYLCAFGGADSGLEPTVNAECSALSSSGAPGPWQAVTPLPQPTMWHMAFAAVTP